MTPNPFVLPTLAPAPHSEQDVIDALKVIFANFLPASNQFSMYFQLMPVAQSVDDLQGLLSGATSSPGTVISRQLHNVGNPAIVISGVVPQSLITVPPLDVFTDANQPPGGGGGRQNSIFIVLDGFNNTPVPIEIACAMEANFIDGFVTRLVLGQFKRFWDSDPNTASTSGFAPSPDFSLNLGSVSANQATLLKFSQPATYPLYHRLGPQGNPDGIPSYADDLSSVLSQSPIASIGMLYGWHAAEQLEQADAGNPATPLLQAAFKLIGFRFSMKDIGEMTAFTLNYLNGAAENSSIQSIIAGSQPGAPPPLNILLQNLSDDPNIDAAKSFLIGFEDVLTAEFYALSQNIDPNLAPDKLNLLTQYFNFLQGFQGGIAKSADAHYRETLELAFGLGYKSGFNDGYALGFTTGYNDGFATGNAVAWAAANKIINGLQAQIANLQTQLAQVQSAQNGGGSGDGFWNTLGKIVDKAKTAIGVISTLTGAAATAGAGAAGAGAAGAGAAGAGAAGAGAAGAGGVAVV